MGRHSYCVVAKDIRPQTVHGLGGGDVGPRMCATGKTFFQLWLEAGGDAAHAYTPAGVAAYHEDFAWVDWMADLDVNSWAFEKAREVRRLCPVGVEAIMDFEDGE